MEKLVELINRGSQFEEWIKSYKSDSGAQISAAMSWGTIAPPVKDPKKEEYRKWRLDVCSYILEHAEFNSSDNRYITAKSNQYTNKKCYDILIGILNSYNKLAVKTNSENTLINILSSVHRYIKPNEVTNETSLQELLYKYLRTSFPSCIKEEAVPSAIGANARIDFLLKDEEIGIEVKSITRVKFTDKQLGAEIAEDIIKYQKHPSCKILYFYIYDPNYKIVNRHQIITDFENKSKDGFQINVMIKP